MPSRRASTALYRSCALLLVALPRVAAGQTAPCTYDSCGLRVESKVLSTRLVAGREGRPVARLGMFPPQIRVLAQAPDSARYQYLAFRSSQRSGAWLSVAGLALIVGGAILASEHPRHDGLSVGVLAGGFALSIGSSFSFRRGWNHLQRAVWWYNRDLSSSP